VAHELGELHREDGRLGFAGRKGMSMLLAIRPWELAEFQDLRRVAARKSGGVQAASGAPRSAFTPATARAPRSVRPR
jgi:hypothetical protein